MKGTAAALETERYTSLPVWLTSNGPDVDVIISTRIRLARNLANHSFPPHASMQERKTVYEKVSVVFNKSAQFKTFNMVNFAALERLDQEFLVERRVASPDLLRLDGERGIASDRSMRLNIMINEEDHVRLQCIDSGCRPLELWNDVDLIDEGLGKKLHFAYNGRKGFLTCCPTNSGTGLRVSFLMHLPALVLTKTLDSVLQGASQMGIATRGFFGEHSEAYGAFFQLSNGASMGACETEFIESTERTIKEIAAVERKARERLIRDASLELTDKIFRAYGILLHAKTLSVPEYLNLSSALRLGLATGLFADTTIENLNRSYCVVMPAHLQKFCGRAMDDTELSVVRAERVRELLFAKPRRPRKRTST